MHVEFCGGYRSLFAVALHCLAFLLVIGYGSPEGLWKTFRAVLVKCGEHRISVIGSASSMAED
jgi:hypothetical protein